MSELNKKKRIRAGHRSSVTKIVAKINVTLQNFDSETDRNVLRQLKETLTEKIATMKALDEAVIELMSLSEGENVDEELVKEIEETDDSRSQMRKVLLDIEDALGKREKANGESAPTADNHNSVIEDKSVRAKLPELQMKKFGGNVQEWQEFWDFFDSTVNRNKRLTDVDKFSYLQGQLFGSAKTTITGFALTAANYQEALELLQKRYGKKNTIQKAHIQELLNLKAVTGDRDLQRLRSLYDKCETNYRGLKSLGVDESSYSTIVVPGILEKLPESFRLTITRGVNFIDWSMKDLLEALSKEIELREAHESVNAKNESKERKGQSHSYSYAAGGSAAALHTRQNQTQRTQSKCAFCLQDHPHEKCEKVTNVDERRMLVRRFGRCFICLKKGHLGKNCKSNISCNACGKRHHSSICESEGRSSEHMPDNTRSQNSTISNVVGTACPCVGSPDRVALQTAQALLKGENENMRVRVLFDSGSQRSFVTQKVVERAGVPVKRREWVEIRPFGQEKCAGKLRDVLEVNVAPVKGGESVGMEVYCVDSISQIRNEHVETRKKDYPHLKGLWFSDVCKAKDVLEVEMLIGADYLWLFQEGRTVRGRSDEPVAVETKLGWVLSGPLKVRAGVVNDGGSGSGSEVNSNFVAVAPSTSRHLDASVKRLWDFETLGIREEDEACELLNDSIHFNGQRYSVSLPWKEGHGTLPSNYSGSVQRLKGLLSKLRKEPEVLIEYDRVIKEQLDIGIIEPVVDLEKAEKIHYLPHHAVVRREAKTTKVRVVYDASSKETKKGVSLNDCLHVGPPLSPLLFHILLRFRTKRVALVADIEKAFLNIEVDKVDRDCLRFLWVSNVDDQKISPVEYRFCRVVFGVSSSPFLLNATLQHHLDKYREEDPEFVRKMKDSFYVDDLVGGGDTDEQALAVYESGSRRLAEGGFRLRKWMSNSKSLLVEIGCGEEQKASQEIHEDLTYAKSSLGTSEGPGGSNKVLGVGWNIQLDTLQFSLLDIVERARALVVTKRNILSVMASIYDPLGIISPVAVRVKILFQELCVEAIDWDTELDDRKRKYWVDWVRDLETVGQITVPRCVYGNMIGETKCSLHGFADASMKAYCAVVYFVCELNGAHQVELLTSKTRIAPMKAQTIPRLELMSARILATLMDSVKIAIGSYVEFTETKYWLDSKTALCWINNHGEWKQFVRHRVNEILRLTSKEDWGHCPGVENPADLGSRGVSACELKEGEIWWKGPNWLCGPKAGWPAVVDVEGTEESLLEVKKACVMQVQEVKVTGIENVVEIRAYSKLSKLLRVTAFVLRFVRNLKERRLGRALTLDKVLQADEIRSAEELLIKSVQASLKSRGDYEQLVKQLGIVEREGILRCKGRLANADLEQEAREPIILPKDHWFTELIITSCHQRVHHCGLRSTLAELRCRFWVPRGRQVVKKVIGRCLVCSKHMGKSYGAPTEAQLPQFRVRPSPPFSKIGVDFAGPLFAKEGNEMVKVYIALFTCCVTRAVHLDLVRSLSAFSFINCLRRFTSRRGTPTLIVSDNGKTFKAASRILRSLFEEEDVKAYLGDNCVKWRFNLERTPWWGGFFERLIGMVKGCLKKVLGNAKMTHEELLTTLVEVEGTLNNRPLTYVYDEVEADVLTPAHLIFGRRIMSLPDERSGDEEEDGGKVTRRFRYLGRMLAHFWRRWQKEYLANLREFHRGRNAGGCRDVKVGDVVLLFEDNKKRGLWKMGRIESLVVGKDEVVRGATVKVMTKGAPVFLSRPVQKLYPVELSGRERTNERGDEIEEQVRVEQVADEIESGLEKVVDSTGGRRAKRAAALDAQWKIKNQV